MNLKGTHDLDAIYDQIDGKQPLASPVPLPVDIYVVTLCSVVGENLVPETYKITFKEAEEFCLQEGWVHDKKEDVYLHPAKYTWRKITKVSANVDG